MKRIKEYKTLFNVEGALDLKDLKKTYRSLVKQWHPDSFKMMIPQGPGTNLPTKTLETDYTHN